MQYIGLNLCSSLLQVLEADNNCIENLEGVYHLPKLEELLLKNNSILKPTLFLPIFTYFFQNIFKYVAIYIIYIYR